MKTFSSRFGFTLFSILGVEAERTQSEGRAKAEWRHSVKTNPRLAISRPFANAKIARINDMANFFEQKMSLFPLLKKRGSLWSQRRDGSVDVKHVFYISVDVKNVLITGCFMLNNSKIRKILNINTKATLTLQCLLVIYNPCNT